jgi:serine/threonine protein kinase/DNA-binding SARP family transcriptional activator
LKSDKQHQREHLARLVNEGIPDGQAATNLEQVIRTISKTLGKDRATGLDYIITNKSSISFNPNTPYWVDACLLDNGLQGQPSLETLMEELSQVGGDLLPDFSEAWVILERERMRGNFEHKILYLLEQLLQQSRWKEANEWGERWIALGEAPEPAYRALMFAHAAKGDIPAVVSDYQRCRMALKQDFGLEPSQQMQETILWIIQGGKPEDLDGLDLRMSPGKPGEIDQADQDDAIASTLMQTGHFPIDTVLNQRYRLEDEIGEGGTGIVYRGFDTLLERNVAVKVLNRTLFSQEASQRILTEAQAIARLSHPNIVVIHDAGEAYGAFYLVLEYLEAGTLAENMPTSLDDIIQISLFICAALSQVHNLGIVHRDLKPENVMITPDGTAKLMDFGLARFETSRLTQEGNILGTVSYMAPEQALGKEIDPRADLYALGVMLYEMTTKKLPFRGDDPLTVITQHLYRSVDPPRNVNPEIPSSLEVLILQLMSKSPEDRPNSADEVSLALQNIYSEDHDVIPLPSPEKSRAQKPTPPEIIWYEESKPKLELDNIQAVSALVRQWREQGQDTLDIASMAIIHNSPPDLRFKGEDAIFITRSALYQEIDFDPWLKRLDSNDEAVRALKAVMDEYPKPHIRLKIVAALSSLDDDQAAQVLLEITAADDSPTVRSEAAVAAARNGYLDEVVQVLQKDIQSGDDLAAEAAFVAVMDEVGLPEDVGTYPKFSVALALARRRMRYQWGIIFRQAGRAAAGAGLLMALNGLIAPFYVALSFPGDYQEILEFMPLQIWVISGALGSLLLGAPQGFASGLMTGIADALWRARARRIMRLILGALSGLVLASTTILVAAADTSSLPVSPVLYNIIYICYGLLMGAILTITIPKIGNSASRSTQLRRALQAASLATIVTLVMLVLFYREEFFLYIPARLMMAIVLPFGIAMALVRRNQENQV